MNRILFLAAALVLLASCNNVKKAPADQGRIEDYRQLTGFERVELSGSMTVEYMQADSFSVMVEGPKLMVDNVVTEVSGNKLTVKMKWEEQARKANSRTTDHVTVSVTSPDLIDVHLNGSGTFSCHRRLDTDILNLVLNGSGEIEFEDVVCDRVRASLTGSGDIEAERIMTRLAQIELVGSGDVKMDFNNSGTVVARLKGSGDIKLMGEVSRLDSRVQGSGKIRSTALRINNGK